MLRLLNGEFSESLRYNPMTVPLVVLLVTCAGILAHGWMFHRRLCLPEWVLRAWIVLLVLGWVSKLFVPPTYW